MAPVPETSSLAPEPRNWLRTAFLGAFAAAAITTLLILMFELARSSVPQHRAALERLVRAQTGLDVRFTELGLRWGWYGPEAVFRQVELDEPGSNDALLRAPELVVGFDAWRTLRSGHPEAGRIELVAPEIDFASAHRTGGLATPVPTLVRPGSRSAELDPSVLPLSRVAVLQRWRGGRIDIDGGTLHLPGTPDGGAPVDLKIRRAALRRTDDTWSMTGLLFLPDRVGRSARISLDVQGDLGDIATLGGKFSVEARRIQFAGLRLLLAGTGALSSMAPDSGGGDLTLDFRFSHGRLSKIHGTVQATTVAFDSILGAREVMLDRVRAGWGAERLASGWRVHVSSTGSLNGTISGIQLSAAAGNLWFDWEPQRAAQRLRASGRFDDLALAPATRDFVLTGLSVQLNGSESSLLLDLGARNARLLWPGSRQPPLTGVRVASSLRFDADAGGWQLFTDHTVLEHESAALNLKGAIQGELARGASVGASRIAATGTLSGADVPLVMRLLNDPGPVYGAVASHLKSGQVQSAEFTLRGPLGGLPFTSLGDGFTGSLMLRRATLSGGDLWPDAEQVDARVEWRGSRVQANVQTGRAGPFQLNSAKVLWDAAGHSPTRLAGHVAGRLEDTLAWVRGHPDLLAFAPGIGNLDATGDSAFDVDVSIPPEDGMGEKAVRARVVTSVEGATVRPIPGLPPLERVTGSFVFDSGQVQRSVLTGAWLGGPVTLRVGERADRTGRALSIQAQGAFNSQELAAAANAVDVVRGSSQWTGELLYRLPPEHGVPPGTPGSSGRWQLRADSALLGVESRLPEPFRKRAAASLAAHVEVSGSEGTAMLKAYLGDRVRGLLALKQAPNDEWRVERGSVRFGGIAGPLPAEPVVLIRGRLTDLDFPGYVLAWQHLRKDLLPSLRAELAAERVLAGSQVFDQVVLRVDRTSHGTDLLIDSAAIAGMARWPASEARAGTLVESTPAEIHLARLELPPGVATEDVAALLTSLGSKASLSIDELGWRGRSLGRLTADVIVQPDSIAANDLKLSNGVHDGHGTLSCRTPLSQCNLTFRLNTSDAAETLLDFGLSADVTARSGTMSADVDWRPVPGRYWMVGLRGTLSLSLANGAVRGADPALRPQADGGQPFALLAIPALIRGLNGEGSGGNPLTAGREDLRFSRLEADFELADGSAVTSNLHFDGDAEILMRGRTGLLARDYDQEVWILRGEDRLPAPVRRFGATPRVAAAWLSLRDLLSGGEQRAGAVLRLQGSWDDPMVVPES